MMLIEQPHFLSLGLLAIGLLLVVLIVYGFWQNVKMSKAQPDVTLRTLMLARLAPMRSHKLVWIKRVLFLLSIAFLFVGLANPKIGTQLGTIKREGVDVVFAIDVSKSMLAEDIAPNRIEKAKRIVSETLNALTGDRVGMITYAATAFPQLPITTDYGAARMFLKGVNTDMMSSQGTAIVEAVKLASTYFDVEAETRRILILISDGEDHSDSGVSELVQLAKQSTIQIITIGTGTEAGAPIPESTPRGGFKKDGEGNVVISKLNQVVLEQIATETGGLYLNASDTEKTVDAIRSYLAQLDKTAFETQTYSNYKDQFQWFIAIGLALLIIESVLPSRKIFKKQS